MRKAMHECISNKLMQNMLRRRQADLSPSRPVAMPKFRSCLNSAQVPRVRRRHGDGLVRTGRRRQRVYGSRLEEEAVRRSAAGRGRPRRRSPAVRGAGGSKEHLLADPGRPSGASQH